MSDKAFWAKIGATPMIGQNDLSNEIFTLADAKTLNQFAQKVAWVVCPYGPLIEIEPLPQVVCTQMSYPIFIVVLSKKIKPSPRY